MRDVRCVERPEGCVWCEGRGPTPPLVEPDAVPASLCDPKDEGNCVDFCSRLAPECAVSWRTVPSCLLPSEQEFRRELIRRDTADRPEALVQGRVTDENGRRIEGAKISVWFQGTAIADEVSGKDGSFHLRLRTGPWTYFVRVSRAGLATEIADVRIEKPGTTQRTFRLAAENVIRGRVVSNKGEPIAGATVHAFRNAEDPVASGEAQSAEDGTYALGGLDARRYFLRASKFGWLPETLKWTVNAPAKGVGFKLIRTGVIQGRVVDADGEGQANATVVALLSAGWRDVVTDHLARRQRRQVRPGPLPGRHLLPLGAPRRDAGLPAREDRDQRPGAGRRDRAQARPQGRARARAGGHHALGRRRRAGRARRAGGTLAAGAAAQGGG